MNPIIFHVYNRPCMVANDVCFECLRFCLRLSLSVNGRMTCVYRNCHLTIQKFWHLYYWKWPNANLAGHFKIRNIYILECEWLNGNSNDLCTAELPFGSSHSNSNANGNWGIQNAPNDDVTRNFVQMNSQMDPYIAVEDNLVFLKCRDFRPIRWIRWIWAESTMHE